jgi:hypothetical protein
MNEILCGKLSPIQQSFVSVYRVYFVSVDNILRYVRSSVLYKEAGLRLFVCACYSWELGLDLSLNVLFNNM